MLSLKTNHSEESIIIVKEFSNEIHYNGEINQQSMSELINKLLEIENKIIKKTNLYKKKLAEEDFSNFFSIEPKPIKLYICSYGGYIREVFSAIDTITNLSLPVHTYIKGVAASAATLLSLAGEKRFITENSFMLIHELRTGTWGTFSQIKDSLENSTQLHNHIIQYYINNTRMKEDELHEQLKKDVYFSPEKCLEVGLIDEIIKTKNLKRKRE